YFFSFFFQAEDGIRDRNVTGVQTCALPILNDFIEHLLARNFQNRTIAIIENGSWAPMAAKVIKEKLCCCKNLVYVDPVIKLKSALNATNLTEIEEVANSLCQEYLAEDNSKANKHDLKALFNIGYGLYVVTSNDGKKDN